MTMILLFFAVLVLIKALLVSAYLPQLLVVGTLYKKTLSRALKIQSSSLKSTHIAADQRTDSSHLIDHMSSRRCFLSTAAFQVAVAAPSPCLSMTLDKARGILLPDAGEIEAAVPSDWSGIDNPLSSSMMTRLDESNDAIFYLDPRFVEHVDEQAVATITRYLSNELERTKAKSVLDLCSSWNSHVESDSMKYTEQFAGLGMNAKELEANRALTEWRVQDLNQQPALPFKDGSFETVFCQLSIDYLTKPIAVCREIGRVLKPGGRVHIVYSNRLFLSKAVALWTGADDIDHTFTVASYLHFCDGGFQDICARDLSIRKGREQRISGDPVYVVTGTKRA